MAPAAHILRGLGWFRAAGLTSPVARTFVADDHAPLSDEQRLALLALFKMRWLGATSELTQEDRAAYQRLCLPESQDFLSDHPDYYALFTYSMFHGTIGGQTDSYDIARLRLRPTRCMQAEHSS